ncbi:MAG: 2-keto-4-pentenoate hydratase [Sulfuricurvum sp. PC08-66]|nr:MAG: 2-keto-4-pentenoate hydratase [Sulfuricurvum sp. PC08-66]
MNTIDFDHQSLTPSKIVCVGRNYVEHIHELGNEIPENLVLFTKPNSAISTQLYDFGEQTRFEGEICFVVIDGALAGVGFGLDLTKADIQNHLKAKGLPWERAKAFDGSAVFGRFVPFGRVEALSLKLYKHGTLVQHALYALMMYKPAQVLAEIGTFMTLNDGDIIMSGTPKGVGGFAAGDLFTYELYEGERVIVSGSFEVVASPIDTTRPPQ